MNSDVERGVDLYYDHKFKEAFEILIDFEDDGNALNTLGKMYEHGKGVEKDIFKAAEYYTDAINKGNHYESKYRLAKIVLKQKEVDDSHNAAIRLLESSGEQGYTKAHVDLGNYYANGKYVEKSYEKAYELYEKAALRSDPEGCYRQGLCIFHKYVEGSMSDAFSLFNNAEFYGKHKEAIYMKGIMRLKGLYMMADANIALIDIQKSADLGYSMAQVSTARLLMAGVLKEPPYPHERAIDYLIKAYEQSDKEAITYLDMLFDIVRMHVLKEDLTNSRLYYDYHVFMESMTKDATAYIYGRFLIEGIFVDKDIREGLDWLIKAAKSKNPIVSYQLGIMNRYGKIVGQDDKLAFGYYYISAEGGYEPAVDEIIQLYEEDFKHKLLTKAYMDELYQKKYSDKLWR